MTSFFVSVITMDHLNFEDDIKLVENLGVDGLHIDIMDGHFVPRYGIYPEIAEKIAQITNLKIDLHMMVDDIYFSLKQFSKINNIDYVRFHIEACTGNEMRAIDEIREIGAKPIACINLSTSFYNLERLIENNEIDGIMLMGIHPGVLDQQHRAENILNDFNKLKNMVSGSSAEKHLSLDGAINFSTLKPLKDIGINNFIGGSSSIFKDIDKCSNSEERELKIKKNWLKIKNILEI